MHDSRGRSPPYQLDSRGRLVLTEAQVGDEQNYVCVVRAGAASTEATTQLRMFGECLRAPGKGRASESLGKGLLKVPSPPQRNRRPQRSSPTKGSCPWWMTLPRRYLGWDLARVRGEEGLGGLHSCVLGEDRAGGPRLLYLSEEKSRGKRGPRLQSPGSEPRAMPVSVSDRHLQQPQRKPRPRDHVVPQRGAAPDAHGGERR